MARTVPAWAGRKAPEYLRFISGLPTRDVDWLHCGYASNTAAATVGHGAQWDMVWKGTGIAGTLGVGTHNINLALPVADADLTRLSVRIWADAAAGVAGGVQILSATAGPAAATAAATGSVTRYASAALDVTADVLNDASAGDYVLVTLRAINAFAALHSVHVDSLERGFGTYPGAASTLPAGLSGGMLPIDDGETATDSPLSADLLFGLRDNAGVLANRRQVRACWGDWVDINAGPPQVYRANGGLAPQRIPVMLPIRQGGPQRLTLAAHVAAAPPAARKVWLVALTPGGSIDGEPLAEWSLSAGGLTLSTVDVPLSRIRGRFDRQAPGAGWQSYLSCALIVEGAIPQRDRLALEGVRTTVADDDIINGGWVLNSLTLWG